MRALSILLLSATAWAGDIASRIHLVKITTDVGGGTTSTLAGAALCVGKDGLLMVVGFAVDKPSRDAARQIRVTVITPDGDERDARILRGHEDMRCTFIRLGRGKMPDPVPLQGAPLKVGERAVLLGRYGETMRYAPWRAMREVEAVVTDPRTLYALRDVGPERRGAIVATTDGRLVGFVDSRPPFPAGRGIVAGLGAQTMVVVPAADFADLPHKPPAKAWLGVNLAPFDKPREDYFNVSGDWRGALVTGMSEGSPAEKAGLKLHDLLQSIGDFRFHYERAEDWERMLRGVQRLPLDTGLKMRIVRFVKGPGGDFVRRAMELTIVLNVRATDFADAPETEIKEIGVDVKPATDDWRRRNNVPDSIVGAVVIRTKRASPARLAGLRVNDLVLAVDGMPVQNPKELVKRLADARKTHRAKVVLLLRRGAGTTFVAVEPNW